MSASYDPALPTDKDKVRFLIGDTTSPFMIPDETINAILAINGNIFLAASLCARSIATSESAQEDSISLDGLSVSKTLGASYSELADKLEHQYRTNGGKIAGAWVSGISISEMDSVDQDPDRLPNKFKIGQSDNEEVIPDAVRRIPAV